MKALENVTRCTVVLASPWGIAPEGAVCGNPHNAHRSYLYYLDYARLGYEVAALGPKDRLGGEPSGLEKNEKVEVLDGTLIRERRHNDHTLQASG